MSSIEFRDGVAWITDPEVTPRLLANWNLRYLAPFLGREASLSDAAAELGVSRTRMHYQLRRLLAGALLHQTRVETRGRHRVKLYRAVAEVVFLPFDFTRYETVEIALARASEPWRSLFLHSLMQVWKDHPGEWGTRIERAGAGGIRATLTRQAGRDWSPEEPDFPAVLLGGWVTDLALDFGDAKAFQAELSELVRRHLGRGGAQRYMLQVRLAPFPPDREPALQVTIH